MGKGSKWRKGTDFNKYRGNDDFWDGVEKRRAERKSTEEVEIKKKENNSQVLH